MTATFRATAHVLTISEATQLVESFSGVGLMKHSRQLTGVVTGINQVRGKQALYNLKLTDGKDTLFVYNISNGVKVSRDGIPFEVGDTLVIETMLEKFRGAPRAYQGVVLDCRFCDTAGVDPTVVMIEQTQSDGTLLMGGFIVCLLVTIGIVIYFVHRRHLRVYAALLASRDRAQIDPVTGLYGRVKGEEQIGQWLQKSEAGYLSIVDIDSFRDINARHGRAVGDLILRQVGQCLHINKQLLVMRMEGDQFVIYSRTKCKLESYYMRLCRLVQRIKSLSIPAIPGEQISVTIGSVYYDGTEAVVFDQLFQAASALLCKQKGFQRGQVKIEPYKAT